MKLPKYKEPPCASSGEHALRSQLPLLKEILKPLLPFQSHPGASEFSVLLFV